MTDRSAAGEPVDELLEQFLIEGRELVQQAADDLLALERDPRDAERIDSVFRAVHTLKGATGLFDLAPMGVALHAAEDLLDAIRGGRLQADRTLIDGLMDCIERVDRWIGVFGEAGALPPDAVQDGPIVAAALRRYDTGLAALTPSIPVTVPQLPEDGENWLEPIVIHAGEAVAAAKVAGEPLTALDYVPAADCFFRGDDPLAIMRTMPGLLALTMRPRMAWTPDRYDPFRCNLVIDAVCRAPIDQVRALCRMVADQVTLISLDAAGRVVAETVATPGQVPAKPSPDEAKRLLRIDATQVDAMADLTGELIVRRNELAGLIARVPDSEAALKRGLMANDAELGRLIGDVHRRVMGLRQLPLSRSFRRFPRLVREIAVRLGKTVVFTAEGDEIEADRVIVDGLFEPLMHVLRNAVDHGIEDAATRHAAGKPAAGRITMAAACHQDFLTITVRDDGSGLDTEKIRHVAKARRVMPDDAIDALDEASVSSLIFLPGFSTASAVSDVSGRGVGMDAVRVAIEALGGRVTASGMKGAGTTIAIGLPRTMTVTAIVTVWSGGERFGVPMEAVTKTMRLAAKAVVPLGDGEAFVHEGRTVPLMRLSACLGFDDSRTTDDGSLRVLMTPTAHGLVGVAVERFGERADVLLRPLPVMLAGMRGLRATALLGDGHVLIVLDLEALIG